MPLNYRAIRPDVLDSLKRYIEHGIPTGGFLEAVLSNDLREAIGRADDYNMRTLPEIVSWIYNEAPSGCWGSPKRVTEWIYRRNSNVAETENP